MDYNTVLAINFAGLMLSIYATGIVFVFRSSPWTTNRRRNSAGGSYKGFLELVAKIGAFNILILALDMLFGLERNPMLLNMSYFFSFLYVGVIGAGLLCFVTIGDLFSKILMWYQSRSNG